MKESSKKEERFFYGLKGAKTTTELCPPNPNELEIAAEISRNINYLQKIQWLIPITLTSSILIEITSTFSWRIRVRTNIDFMLFLHIGNSIDCHFRLQVLHRREDTRTSNHLQTKGSFCKMLGEIFTSWLMVGCSQPVVIAFTVAMASNPPAAPSPCPIID